MALGSECEVDCPNQKSIGCCLSQFIGSRHCFFQFCEQSVEWGTVIQGAVSRHHPCFHIFCGCFSFLDWYAKSNQDIWIAYLVLIVDGDCLVLTLDSRPTSWRCLQLLRLFIRSNFDHDFSQTAIVSGGMEGNYRFFVGGFSNTDY